MMVPGTWLCLNTLNGRSAVCLDEVAAVEAMPNGYALIYLNGGKVIETVETIQHVLELLEFGEAK